MPDPKNILPLLEILASLTPPSEMGDGLFGQAMKPCSVRLGELESLTELLRGTVLGDREQGVVGLKIQVADLQLAVKALPDWRTEMHRKVEELRVDIEGRLAAGAGTPASAVLKTRSLDTDTVADIDLKFSEAADSRRSMLDVISKQHDHWRTRERELVAEIRELREQVEGVNVGRIEAIENVLGLEQRTESPAGYDRITAAFQRIQKLEALVIESDRKHDLSDGLFVDRGKRLDRHYERLSLLEQRLIDEGAARDHDRDHLRQTIADIQARQVEIEGRLGGAEHEVRRLDQVSTVERNKIRSDGGSAAHGIARIEQRLDLALGALNQILNAPT